MSNPATPASLTESAPRAAASPAAVPDTRLSRSSAAVVFLAFAAAYFCSALVRSITATLSPVLTQEFALQASDLGLLGGGYFLGFAAMQLPLGAWLDRHGPKRVILWFLSLAVLGCLAFSSAGSFAWLLAARVLVGMGVGACLMAPLTGYRRWFDAPTQLRANSWMLMTGSLGMLASTLPVQWLMPMTGWRPLFWILAAMIVVSMAVIGRVVPRWGGDMAPTLVASRTALPPEGAELARGGPSLRSALPPFNAVSEEAELARGGPSLHSASPPFNAAAGEAELARSGPSLRSALPPFNTAAGEVELARSGPSLRSALPPFNAVSEEAELARGGPSLRSALPPFNTAAGEVELARGGPPLRSALPAPGTGIKEASYAEIWSNRFFRKMSPLAFFNYGGLVAIQTLWAGPWMVKVAGYSALESATGLFYINACMLVTFWSWGLFNPWLARRGWHATRLMAWGVPLSLLSLGTNIVLGAACGWLGWALFCVTSSVMGLAQPAVGMAFRASLAGRALSGYNLIVFSGVFVVQWSIGLLVDGFASRGVGTVPSFQAAMAVLWFCCLASYLYFLRVTADNQPS